MWSHKTQTLHYWKFCDYKITVVSPTTSTVRFLFSFVIVESWGDILKLSSSSTCHMSNNLHQYFWVTPLFTDAMVVTVKILFHLTWFIPRMSFYVVPVLNHKSLIQFEIKYTYIYLNTPYFLTASSGSYYSDTFFTTCFWKINFSKKCLFFNIQEHLLRKQNLGTVGCHKSKSKIFKP